MRKQFTPDVLDTFSKEFTGEIIRPYEQTYDEARSIYNTMIDKKPAVIAQCADTDDVIRAVRFGRDQGLEIAVRGGGHSVAGRSLTEGGIVVDLRRMNAVSVDPEARTVTVAGGATMSHLDRATQSHGLAVTGGRVSSTGIGGFTLGGGDGWLSRKFGLACDNLLSVELVTADANVVRASNNENPELFWALHGGGGNFGVATSLSFRLYELPSVTVALMLWRAESGPEIMRAYRDFMIAAPEEIGGGAIYISGPEEPFVPKHLVKNRTFAILVIYAGPEPEAREVVAPLLNLNHEGELITEMPYADMQSMFDDPPIYRNYSSAEYLDSFPEEAINLFCSRASDMLVPSPSQQILFPQGGALERGNADYPIPWRSSPWCVHPFGFWKNQEDDEQVMQWVRNLRSDLKPWASGATYLNFIGDEGEDRVVAGFGKKNYTRLSKVKKQYDPENVFHLNHNIKPS
jgi:FAD/FMN-containing dehydrogenase